VAKQARVTRYRASAVVVVAHAAHVAAEPYTMKLNEFIANVSALVRVWESDTGELPRDALANIYAEVRNSCAYELAQAVEQRDRAMAQLHKHHLKGSYDNGHRRRW
jgi:hypothetical protein